MQALNYGTLIRVNEFPYRKYPAVIINPTWITPSEISTYLDKRYHVAILFPDGEMDILAYKQEKFDVLGTYPEYAKVQEKAEAIMAMP